jgi:dipeptidase E
VDFSVFPHLNHPMMPENTLPAAQRWAANLTGPCYAMDDQSAIRVQGGTVEVVSDGEWVQLTPH